MFGIGKRQEDLEQRLRQYGAALEEVARYVGVDARQMTPSAVAAAVCERIDALSGRRSRNAAAQEELSPSAEAGSEIRPIAGSVRAVKLSGIVDVVVRQGAEPRLEVFANNAAALPKILTKVAGETLTIGNEPMVVAGSGRPGGTLIVSGSGNRVAMGSYIVGDVVGGQGAAESRSEALGFRVEVTLPGVSKLRISGTGDLTYMGLEQDELRLDVSGTGTISVGGKVSRLEAAVSGAGKVAAYQLVASHARLDVSGAGDIRATATSSVDASVSGVGSIKIKGNPPQRETDVSGVGRIKFVSD